MTDAKLNTISEAKLQANIYRHINTKYPITRGLFYAVPNGAYLANKAEANKLIATGLLPGVSDMNLDIPNNKYHGLRMELKLPGKTQSQHQINYQNNVTKFGYLYIVVTSVEEADQVIGSYLKDSQYV